MQSYWKSIHSFKKYRGAVRVANGLLLCILAAVVLMIIGGAVSGSGWSRGKTMAALERDMRALQAAATVHDHRSACLL